MPDYRLPSLDVVIVAWNHGETLPACVSALQTAAAGAAGAMAVRRVVIVDNASTTPVRMDCRGPLAIEILRNEENAGFAAACNQGARGSRADFVLFLNPDTRPGPLTVADAAAFLNHPARGRAGIVGVPLVDAAGSVQRTCGRSITPSRLVSQTLGLSTVAPALFPGIRLADWDHATTRRVDFVSGAALIARRTMFEELGGFDARFFVYLEDADLSRRARRAGWETWFLACDPVEHGDGWKTGRARPWRLAQSWRSSWRFGWTHFSPAGAMVTGAAVAVGAPAARLVHAALRGSRSDIAMVPEAVRTFWRLLHPRMPHSFIRRAASTRPPRASPTGTRERAGAPGASADSLPLS